MHVDAVVGMYVYVAGHWITSRFLLSWFVECLWIHFVVVCDGSPGGFVFGGECEWRVCFRFRAIQFLFLGDILMEMENKALHKLFLGFASEIDMSAHPDFSLLC